MNLRSVFFLDVFTELASLIPRSYYGRIVLLFVSMTFGSLLEVLGLGLLIPLVGFVFSRQSDGDNLIVHLLSNVSGGVGVTTTALLMAMCVMVFLLKNLYLSAQAWLEASFAFSVHTVLAETLTQRILDWDYPKIAGRSPAGLVTIVTSDISSVVFQCLLPALTVISELLFSGAIVVFLFYVEPTVTPAVVAAVALSSMAFVRSTRKFISGLGIRRQRLETQKGAQLHQVFQGAREILIYGAGPFFQSRLKDSFRELSHTYRDFQLVSTLPRFALEFVAAATLIGVIGVSIHSGQSAQTILTRVALFSASGFRLLIGANRLIMSTQSMRFGHASLRKVIQELSVTSDIRGPRASVPPTETDHRIESIALQSISFSYPGTTHSLLSNVSFSLQADAIAGIVGRSGAGKSTLLDILSGLRNPATGTIVVNGQECLTSMNKLQGLIGYVSQVPIIFNDTIRRNIAFGLADDLVDNARIRAALEDAQLTEFISHLPLGMDTVIGDGGTGLSGGQKQRIAIARALYRRPRILLLDEPTSALDLETELDLIATLQKLKVGRIVVVVSHRKSALDSFDTTIVVADGTVHLQSNEG